MRLIDKDALINIFSHYYGNDKIEVDEVIEWIDEQPTIEERKTGEWIDETFKPWGLVYHPYKCNQCGEHSEADSNFCPNCGADMRGGNT